MSANYELSKTNSNQICRVCLATNDNMYEMNDSEIFAYRNIVPLSTFKVIFNYLEMFLCLYCRHLLRKVMRFTQQCLKAEDILSNTSQEDLKLVSNRYHNFTSTTISHRFPEDDEKSGDDGDRDYDDDDIPLMMLKEDSGSGVWNFPKVKKKRSKNEVYTDTKNEKIEVTLEPIKAEGPHKNTPKSQKQKRQKTLREGFTSRMVQETDEYTVIKLTKEQVLEEMAQQALSERYQRCLYKCESCVKGFNFEDVLLNHMQKHSPDAGPLKCEICTQYCKNAVSMRGHMKSHTTRYLCKVCGLQRGARQHLLEHHGIAHGGGGRYRCRHCSYTTNKRTVMQRHARAHSNSDKLACHLCGELFKDLTTLRVHTVRHDRSRMSRCAHCARCFALPAALQRHIQTAHERSDFYCVECDIRFKSQDNLRLHFKKAKRHRDSSSYKHECSHCSQRFVTPSALAGHLSTAHGLPKQHSCSVCGRAYSSRSGVRAHAKAAHGEGRDSGFRKEENTSTDAMAQPVPNEG